MAQVREVPTRTSDVLSEVVALQSELGHAAVRLQQIRTDLEDAHRLIAALLVRSRGCIVTSAELRNIGPKDQVLIEPVSAGYKLSVVRGE